MTVEVDSSAKFAEYAHPERLVSTEWLQARLGTPGLVVVESDEDVLLYETGHIPGSVKIDWHTDLNDPVERDYINGEQFAKLVGSKGIARDTTVVIYGDKNNWWAAYALWVFTLFGHEDVRLLDGGRAKWEAEGREYTTEPPATSPVDYPVVERNDSAIRAFKDDVLAHFGHPLIDVRSVEEYTGQRTTMPAYPEEGALRAGHIPGAVKIDWHTDLNDPVERDDAAIRAFKDDVLAHFGRPLIDVRSVEEYTGQRTTMPAYPEEGALRAGHIPTAQNVPWAKAVAEDGGFKPLAELNSIYRDGAGLRDGDDVIAYCRIGERSSHTWFVLTHLLGFEGVRNYDGSWTEWGSAVRVPILKGTEPGAVPAGR